MRFFPSGGENDAVPVQQSVKATGNGPDMCQQLKQLEGPDPKSSESGGKTHSDFRNVLPK